MNIKINISKLWLNEYTLQPMLATYIFISFDMYLLISYACVILQITVWQVSTYEELISKTSYIHSYMLLICSSGHNKKANLNKKFTANGRCWY